MPFLLPSPKEIREAGLEYGGDVPEPVAAVVDECPELVAWLDGMSEDRRLPVAQLIKAGLVLGLNLGIRIGERRHQ